MPTPLARVSLLAGATLTLALLASSALAAPLRVAGSSTSALSLPSAPYGYKLVYTPARDITDTYSETWTVTGQTVTGWTYYQLSPPTMPRQHLTMTMAPNGHTGTTQGNMRRPLVYSKTSGNSTQYTNTQTYKGTLYATDLVPLAAREPKPRVAALSSADRAFYTQATSSLDFNSPLMKRWIGSNGLTRKSGESELDFGLRVFAAMRKTLKYNLSHPAQSKASDVVRDRVGVCGGLGWVFAAAMRAGGVPARALSLYKTDQNYDGGGSDEGHCNNDFYCTGIGWVPTDLVGGVCETHDQDALKYYAHDDGSCLVNFDGGDDFTVDMAKLGPTVSRPVKPGSANGDSVNGGLPWGVWVSGGTGGQKQCTTSHFTTQVTVLPNTRPGQTGTGTGNTGSSTAPPQPDTSIDPVGQPPASVTGGKAGYLVWHDAAGWHVHTATDGASHSWGIEIDSVAPALTHAGSTGTATPSLTSLFAEGLVNTDGLNADVKVRAGIKALRFMLALDSADAPADRIWIGRKGAHPQSGIFTLPNGAVSSTPRTLGTTGSNTGGTLRVIHK